MQAHKNVHELAEKMLGSHREHGASDAEPRLPALHDARDRLLAALKSLANEVKVARDNRH
ncbi:hypothetical protein [Paludibacterium denitrificans]|nr:hypothetical protein [Paludibacterium denitrificans]